MLEKLKGEFGLRDLFGLLLGALTFWGAWVAMTARVNALEEKVKPVPVLVTEIEVVKAAVIDIKDGIKEMRQELRRGR
jgi:hypothetical protein